MIIDAGTSMLTTELMPYTSAGVATTYIAEGAMNDNKAKKDDPDAGNDQTIERIRNTLITTATTTASAFAQEILHDGAVSQAEAIQQVEAQAYVDSLSDEELEQALQQVGLLEQDMTFETKKTI